MVTWWWWDGPNRPGPSSLPVATESITVLTRPTCSGLRVFLGSRPPTPLKLGSRFSSFLSGFRSRTTPTRLRKLPKLNPLDTTWLTDPVVRLLLTCVVVRLISLITLFTFRT